MREFMQPSLARAESAIWSYDLTSITNTLAVKGMEDAHAIELEFRKFASLCYWNPKDSLTPSKKVDDYWHEFILNTVSYRKFCKLVYGNYMDHIPGDRNLMENQHLATIKLYGEKFGNPMPECWGQPGSSMNRLPA